MLLNSENWTFSPIAKTENFLNLQTNCFQNPRCLKLNCIKSFRFRISYGILFIRKNNVSLAIKKLSHQSPKQVNCISEREIYKNYNVFWFTDNAFWIVYYSCWITIGNIQKIYFFHLSLCRFTYYFLKLTWYLSIDNNFVFIKGQ